MADDNSPPPSALIPKFDRRSTTIDHELYEFLNPGSPRLTLYKDRDVGVAPTEEETAAQNNVIENPAVENPVEAVDHVEHEAIAVHANPVIENPAVENPVEAVDHVEHEAIAVHANPVIENPAVENPVEAVDHVEHEAIAVHANPVIENPAVENPVEAVDHVEHEAIAVHANPVIENPVVENPVEAVVGQMLEQIENPVEDNAEEPVQDIFRVGFQQLRQNHSNLSELMDQHPGIPFTTQDQEGMTIFQRLIRTLIESVKAVGIGGNIYEALEQLCQAHGGVTAETIAEHVSVDQLRGIGVAGERGANMVKGFAERFRVEDFEDAVPSDTILKKLKKFPNIAGYRALSLIVFGLRRINYLPDCEYEFRNRVEVFMKSREETRMVCSIWEPYQGLAAWLIWKYALAN